MTARGDVLRAELASWQAKIDQCAASGRCADVLIELRRAYRRATTALGDLERGAPHAAPGFRSAMRTLIDRYREIPR